ncbi:MAG: hypothetical protein ACTSRE_03530 [Promethearchaeota archaeon]
MADPIVTRTIHMDFIYFDILFLAIFIFFLVRKKYFLPIIWGFIGWGLYLLIDYYIWYIVMGARTYSGPINPHLFFMWFTFSPGFAQFAYCFVMLEKRNKREMAGFTILYFLGWMAVGSLSQVIPLHDVVIEVARNMSEGNQRLIMTLVALGNVIVAVILVLAKKIRWEDFVFIFIVGTLVELNLELSLLVSGIRLEQGTWNLGLMVVNILVEFNCGITFIYLIFRGFQKIRDKNLYPQLSYKDIPFIKTDYNRLMGIHNNTILPKPKKLIENLYGIRKIEKDLEYIRSKE